MVSLRVAQDWISTQWGSDGLLCIPEQVEELMGDRLRLEQYREHLLTDLGATELSRRLQERMFTTTYHYCYCYYYDFTTTTFYYFLTTNFATPTYLLLLLL